MKCCFSAILACALFLAPACKSPGATRSDTHEHPKDKEHENPAPKGPNGGRLLEEGPVAIEVKIFEAGVPPEFRVWIHENGKPVSPTEAKLSATLKRFGGIEQAVGFQPKEGFLQGDSEIYEPHSFIAEWLLSYHGRTYRFTHEQIEGRTEIAPELAEKSGIRTLKAGPGELRETLRLRGQIVPDRERIAHIHPRYAGIVRKILKSTGNPVAAGDVLAIIESNESLSSYEIRSGIPGAVITRNASVGEFVSTDSLLFTVADFRQVWVELAVSGRDLSRLKPGQALVVQLPGSPVTADVRLDYVSPFVDEDTQSGIARATVPNPKGQWRPGLYVDATLTAGIRKVPVAVRSTALQSFRDWTVVFRKSGDQYEAAPVEVGASDGTWTEVTSGLEPGTEYVSEGSFVVKADILKSEAEHDH